MINLEQFYYEMECNILIVGYRGYGHSQGQPTEEGLELDAEAIFQWAIECKDINKKKIFVFGRSLGGAVAIQLVGKI